MRVTYTNWDADHHRPIDVKAIGGSFPGNVAISRNESSIRLSLSIVGATCDIDVTDEEWKIIRDQIDKLTGI